MGIFIAGAITGGVVMFFTMILLIAQSVDEKEREIKRLRAELEEQKNER